MDDSTYHRLREAGYPASSSIGELVDMLLRAKPEDMTRERITELHAKAVEAKHGVNKLCDAILEEAEASD